MAFFFGSASWGAAACKTFANVAGFPNATIYEGGWCEWCAYPENPVETEFRKNMQITIQKNFMYQDLLQKKVAM